MDRINRIFNHSNFVFLTLLVGLIFPQMVGATIFQPGETLTPDCAPTAPNCGVAVLSFNGQSGTTQTLATGTSGTNFSISSAGNVHTFNLPSSSSLNRGLLSAADWNSFNGKLNIASNLSDLANVNSALNTVLPLQTGNGGKFLQTDGSNTSWVTAAGTGIGTVTSVALSLPSIFSVVGSPITAAGTLSATLASQSPNLVFASPSGAPGTPTFRTLAIADLPTGIPNASLASSAISVATGTTGTDINVSGSPVALGGTLTLNIPSSSALNRGLLTSADWSTFNGKQATLGFTPLNPANNLSDLASASTARTNLGLGTLATQNGTFSGSSSGTNTGDQTTITGNAGTATSLQTPRTINGVSFNGTADITVAAAAGTLTGTTLSGSVVSSSLSSLGTVTTGVWNGTSIAIGNGGTGTTTGSITGTGALSFTSNTTSALTLDSGTTGSINIGTGANAKAITIGNTTTTTSLALQSGTGNISLQSAGSGSTGNIQIGAGGAGSATPDLLVLDVKNTSGDPAGTNGATYYNSNTNKFRCFENSAWKDCDSQPASSSKIVRKSADQAITASTTLIDDTELSFPVAANESWVFQFDLLYSTGSTPDIKVAVTAPAGATCDYGVYSFFTGDRSGTTACGTSTVFAGGNITEATAQITGSVTNGGTAGIVHFQFAQNASNAAATTVQRGSDLTAFRISGADLGEVYYSKDTSLAPGTVVSIDGSLSAGVEKAMPGDKPIGIVSTKPGVVIGDAIGASEGVPVIVALSGRVPVNATAENGAISPGDYLTLSSTSGVAMKSNGTGPVIGQAISSYNSDGVGTVMVFVKNFDLGGAGGVVENSAPNINIDESGIAAISSETALNPIEIVGKIISDGKQMVTDFVAARVTAIRGYFNEVFAKKVHTEELCIKKSDGSEVCIDGDKLSALLQGNSIAPVTPIVETPPVEVPATPVDGTVPVVTPEAPAEAEPAINTEVTP